MSATLRVALAGAGMVAQHHIPAWKACSGVELVALCDLDRAKAEARASTFGIAAVFESLEEMLDRLRPDALDIALPSPQHAGAVLAAAERGIPVLCQKPLAPSLAEAKALLHQLDNRVRLMVHENWRFRSPYRQLQALLREAAFGRPALVRLQVASSGMLPDHHGLRPALERQPSLATMPRLLVLELLIHHLDTLRALFGELRVEAARLWKVSGVTAGEDCAIIQLALPDGGAASLSGTLSAAGEPPLPRDVLTIFGPKASARLEGWSLTIALADGKKQHEVWDPAAGYQQSFDAAIAHFVKCLREGTPFETGPEEALAALALVERIYAVAG